MELSAVNQIVSKAVAAVLKNGEVSRVYAEPMTDSDGRDALRVTIVLKSGAVDGITGDSALGTLVRIQHDLMDSGEDRFGYVDYVSEDELESDGSPQS